MIYLIYGVDTYRSRENLRQIVEKFSVAGNIPCQLFRVTPENFDKNFFLEVARGTSMFGGKYLMVAERVLSDRATGELIAENLAAIRDSENIFVFWEEGLDKEAAERIVGFAKKTQEFSHLSGARLRQWIRDEARKLKLNIGDHAVDDLVGGCNADLWAIKSRLEMRLLGGEAEEKSAAGEPGAMFDLADALSARDKRHAVLLFEKYQNAGVPAEEIFWRLLWAAKNLLVAKRLHSQSLAEIKKATGWHDYVIKKSLAGAARFDVSELENFLKRLLALHTESRIGIAPLDYGILSLLTEL